MRDNITKWKFILICCLYTFNSLIFSLFIFNLKLVHFYFYTTWGLWAVSIYLIIVLICDISFYCFNSNYFDSLEKIMRNTIYKYIMSVSISIIILFWTLTLLGTDFMQKPKNKMENIFNYYLHGLNTIFGLLDLLLMPHENQEKNFFDFLIISIIYWIYMIVCCFAKYYANFNCYQFLVNATFVQLLSASFIMYIVVLNSYQIFMFLLQLKNNIEVKVENDGYEKTHNVSIAEIQIN